MVTYKNELVEPNPKKPEEEKVEYDRFGQRKIATSMRNLYDSPDKSKEEEPVFVPKVSTVNITSYHQFLGSAHLSEYNLNIKE